MLAQNLKDLDLRGSSEETAEQTKARSPVGRVGQSQGDTVPDEKSPDPDDSGSQVSSTNDQEAVEGCKETTDTDTIKESSRDDCERFADMFVRFNTRARNIALVGAANEGRDEEKSYDHFAKSARFQLQMRQRHVVKRLKRETWSIID